MRMCRVARQMRPLHRMQCLRLGYPVSNMEFTQFHPTCFYNPSPKSPDERRVLIAEALRGSSTRGKLVLHPDSTEDLVLPYSPLGSAASRDVVALAIDTGECCCPVPAMDNRAEHVGQAAKKNEHDVQ